MEKGIERVILKFDYLALAMIIQAFILLLFLSRKRLPVRVSREFLLLVVVNLAAIAVDSLARGVNDHWDRQAVWVIVVCNVLYYLMFILRGFMFLEFTAALCEVWERNSLSYRIVVYAPMIIMVLLVVTSPYSGWIFSLTEDGVAHGPLYDVLSWQFLYDLLLMLVMLECRAELGYGHDRTTGYVYTAALALGVFTRMAFPEVPAMSLFCAFSTALIYLGYLNPESFTDSRLNVFNYAGWKLVQKEYFRKKVHHGSLVGFVIRNYSEMRYIYGDRQFEAGLKMIGRYLNRSCRGLNVFYLGTGHFVVQSFKRFDEEVVLGRIASRFTRRWMDQHADLSLSVGMIRLERNCILPDEETVMGCIRYAFEQVRRMVSPGIAVINEQTLREYRRKTVVQQVLNSAVDEHRLQMYLQPIVRAEDEEVVGCEALARLVDFNGEIVYPDEFIPAAEQNGMIIPLGEQMFRKACAFIASERVKLSRLEWINVNLSPIQCMDDSLADRFLKIIHAHDLDARTVFLEVTEKALTDVSLLHKHMARLREEDVSFVLDDFGSFSSNLDRLKENPFMSIKLDRKMVWNYFKSPDSILPHIIAACHEMNLTVVAEGIENSHMAETLRMLGCDYFQGYYYSRPVLAAEFLENYC